jgi:hypothetical protein
MFYNDEGSESGGLHYGGKATHDGGQSSAQLAFDQYDQDEIVSLTA